MTNSNPTRRQFTSAVLGASALARDLVAEPDPGVRRILAMFKCHLDIGFVDTQAGIIRAYFTRHYPNAIRIAESLRATRDQYVWTTGSWLLYEYLEQASPAERRLMENAIAQGHIAWHALPFTWQSELLDPTFIAGAIGFSKSLDRRFGRNTTGAKMTDVPGHSRGLIAPLAQSGVTFLNIGVNSASTPPDVPPVFNWKDPAGNSIVMMYHRLAYGGVVRIPDTDLAIAVEVADDNRGPHTPEEIHRIYAELRRQYPNATIQAANLTEIANAVTEHKAAFPVLTQEIGDTWIYGVASDPVKLARFREILRLRRTWIDHGKLQPGDKTDLAFLSRFSLAAEHTWGTDTKTWLDFDHYTPEALAGKLNDPKYKTVTNSWVEKRNDIAEGISRLPSPLREDATRHIAAMKPIRPSTAGMKPARSLDGEHFTIDIDPATGAIARMRSKSADREWTSLAIFSYQTLSKADYDRFLASYITVQTDWAPKDFGKPNIEKFGAESRIINARLVSCLAGDNRLVARQSVAGLEVYTEITLPGDSPRVDLNIYWFHKRSNRLPEALWLTMNPATPLQEITKAGGTISPNDVVSKGNRHMHAVDTGLRFRDGLTITTLDAPLVVLGEQSPIFFSNDLPDPAAPIHFSLFNNGWGTNYVQWFGEDMRFRFSFRIS